MNNQARLNIGSYKDSEYYTSVNYVGDMATVKFNKKEDATVKHGLLISGAIVAAIMIAAYKLDGMM